MTPADHMSAEGRLMLCELRTLYFRVDGGKLKPLNLSELRQAWTDKRGGPCLGSRLGPAGTRMCIDPLLGAFLNIGRERKPHLVSPMLGS